MTVKEFYEQIGGDYEDALGRLQNDVLIKRFLKMLPKDDSIHLLEDAMQASDAEKAFRAVHTLKGVSLNLSLKVLAGACSVMTEALRGAASMPEKAAELYENVKKEYALVSEGLSQLGE